MKIKGGKKFYRQWPYHVPLQSLLCPLSLETGQETTVRPVGRVREASVEAADMPSTRIFSLDTALQLSTLYRLRKYFMKKKHVYTCSVELQKSFISTRYLECCPLKLYSFISWFTNTKTMLIRTFSINEKCHNRGWFS